MAYTHVPDHGEQAVDLLHFQHKDDEDLKKLLRVFMVPLQRIEDALPGLYRAFDLSDITTALIDDVTVEEDDVTANDGDPVWITSSSGQADRLTRLGAVLGELRNGRFDSEYLPYVVARAIINTSNGSASRVYAVARTLLGTTNNTLRVSQNYPAGFLLTVSGAQIEFPWDHTIPADVVASALADELVEAIGAGISMRIQFQTADDANTFTLSTDDTVQTSTNMGCANDILTTGGHLVGLEVRDGDI